MKQPIVYSAVSKDGEVIRFSLHKCLDSENQGHAKKFKKRAVWDDYATADGGDCWHHTNDFYVSCRCEGATKSLNPLPGRQGGAPLDEAIDWLLEGE